MKKLLPYSIGFFLGVIMVLLFSLTFDASHIVGRILFGVSMALWPVFILGITVYNLVIVNNDALQKNILTKALFMPLPGAILIVALLYLIT